MVRLGLCCKFDRHPVRFRTTTATSLLRLGRDERLHRLSALCLANARALAETLEFCAAHGVGAFRINSQILPVKTHPEAGYETGELPEAEQIVDEFRECGRMAAHHGLRLSFHPDQFVLLSSPDHDVTVRAIRDLVYQAEVAEWVGADVINIHAGGVYNDRQAALARVRRAIEHELPDRVRTRLTLENDDRSYTPSDLLPLCRATGVPLVYDVHHHRCLPDGLSEEDATHKALGTWNREPLVHLSSPKQGWGGADPKPHHDLIDPRDFPVCWQDLNLTVEVEAKAKERAVAALRQDLAARGTSLWTAVG